MGAKRRVARAQLFAEGRLSVPAPEPRAFFHFYHIVNDGKYYGKYAPGWPALLALGVKGGVPWLVNPLLACITLLLIYRIAKQHYSTEVANIALLITALNPYLVFNSASFFSHPSALLFATLVVLSFHRCLESPREYKHYLAFGSACGVAFLIRPYTAVALLAPFGVAFLWTSLGSERRKAVVGLLVAHFFFLFDPGNEYGPRYLFESTSMIVVLMAGVLARLKQLGAVILVGMSIWNAAMMWSRSHEFGHEVEERTELFEVVEEQGLSNAIVLLRTGSGSMPRKDLTRNRIHFDDQPVLYVLDRGERNVEMIDAHPNRRVYYYEYDEETVQGRLISH